MFWRDRRFACRFVSRIFSFSPPLTTTNVAHHNAIYAIGLRLYVPRPLGPCCPVCGACTTCRLHGIDYYLLHGTQKLYRAPGDDGRDAASDGRARECDRTPCTPGRQCECAVEAQHEPRRSSACKRWAAAQQRSTAGTQWRVISRILISSHRPSCRAHAPSDLALVLRGAAGGAFNNVAVRKLWPDGLCTQRRE